MPNVSAVDVPDRRDGAQGARSATRAPAPDRIHEFSVEISFNGSKAVVGVHGDLDAFTAPMFGALLGVLVGDGHREVVLDLAALAFMDASGLRVFADVATRLKESKGVLTLRSASAQTLLILHLTGMSKLVQLEVPASEPVTHDRLGQLPSDFARSASIPARNDAIDAALRLVAVLASVSLQGADGVSVSLERHGRLTTVASSNETILQMDAHQYETGQGPCLAAAAEGEAFRVDSLADEIRWPAFVPLAKEEGIASILSTPLMVADRPVGALNVYSNTAGVFGPQQQALAAVFASHVSAILVDTHAIGDDHMGRRIVEALHTREVTAQARGVLMARHGVTAEDAAAMLHRAARAAKASVLHQATEMIASTRADLRPDR